MAKDTHRNSADDGRTPIRKTQALNGTEISSSPSLIAMMNDSAPYETDSERTETRRVSLTVRSYLECERNAVSGLSAHG
uniref:Uncharacterized protein n=1 Tax=Panagrellus redivivus TaxID=6233 RepID=A0A7E4W3U5_PANRE